MPIEVKLEEADAVSERDEGRLLAYVKQHHKKLFAIHIFRRAGRSGDFGYSGIKVNVIHPDELEDKSVPMESPDQIVEKVLELCRAHKEQRGPHVYQIRLEVHDGEGSSKMLADPVAINMLETSADFGTTKDAVRHYRADEEAISLMALHKLYRELLGDIGTLVKNLSTSPLAMQTVELRKLDIQAAKEARDDAADEETSKEVLDFLKQIALAKLLGGNAPGSAFEANKQSPLATKLRKVVGGDFAALAKVLDPKMGEHGTLPKLVREAMDAKSDDDFREKFRAFKSGFEDLDNAQVVMMEILKTIGLGRGLELKELFNACAG